MMPKGDTGSTPTTDSDPLPPLVVGETRIRDVDGFVGTVAYVGPVASAKNTKEEYAGIVWDDPSRGKHDGSVLSRATNQVVRHFGACGPTQGSFLRLHKLDRGVGLTAELLQGKYVEMQAPILAPNNLLPHTARTSSGQGKPIEFLGELQIRQRQQLENIHKISLRREGISCAAASGGKITEAYGENIRDVDLAGNLLSTWPRVLEIMQLFPHLTDFSVAYNRIRDVTLPPLVPSLDRLRVLNLNSCGIQSYATMEWVAQSMPNLESLCIASSNLSDMEQQLAQSSKHGQDASECVSNEKTSFFAKLRILDCSNCQLTSWESQVRKCFGSLPCLEQLSLDGNPISSIPSETSAVDTDPVSFVSLASLQVAGTALSSWSDLEGVNSLPNLRSLRLKNTPLTSTLGQGEVRFLSVARVPSLEYWNGSVISSKERIEAERRYVTLVAHQWNKVERENKEEDGEEADPAEVEKRIHKEHQEILLEHPQYERLREKHSNLIIFSTPNDGRSNGGPNASATNLASSVCNVTIRSMVSSSCTMEPLIRRLPGTLTVGRLKSLCSRVFALDVDLMTLHFRTEADAFPVELDVDDNTLNYYGVSDGAEILMNEIDLDARRREADRQAQEQDKRIRQQEREATAIQDLKRENQQR